MLWLTNDFVTEVVITLNKKYENAAVGAFLDIETLTACTTTYSLLTWSSISVLRLDQVIRLAPQDGELRLDVIQTKRYIEFRTPRSV